MNGHIKLATVTPLKANSERVQGKNFKVLAGKPLYMWVTEKMLEIQKHNRFDFESTHHIYCDYATWHMLYPEVTENCIWLEEKEAGSATESNIFFREIADKLEDKYDYIMYANATSPFVKMDTYYDCIDAIKHSQYDSALTAIQIQGRVWDHYAHSINHDPATCPRTQSQDPVWIESDGLWVVKKYLIADYHRRVGFMPKFVPVDQFEQIDINVPRDFEIAERLITAGINPGVST